MIRFGRYLVLTLVGIGFVLGLVVGASARPGPEPAIRPFPSDQASEDPGAPSRDSDAEPSGHAKPTREGAVEAAADIVMTVDSPDMFDPSKRAYLVRSIAAAGHERELAETTGRVAELVAQQLGLDADIRSRQGFVWRAIPAGWRINHFERGEATVSVWATGAVVLEGRQLDQPGWQTADVRMRWERDDWRLVSLRTRPGPTPPLPGMQDTGVIGREIASFQPFVASAGRSGTSQ